MLQKLLHFDQIRYLIRTRLFGSNSFNTDANTNFLNASIKYIPSAKIFDEPLFR